MIMTTKELSANILKLIEDAAFEDEAFDEIERKQQVEKDTALRNHTQTRACEVMRELSNAELSQMTMLQVFALGYRAAVLDEQRKKNGN